jgi:hypothetical protein
MMLALAAPAAQDQDPPRALPQFTDVTEQAGIEFVHSFGDHELSNIVEATGPGCGWLDYDGDGRLDLYLVNGRWTRGVSDNKGRDLRGKLSNTLYRNQGDGTFVEVTEQAGVGDAGYGMGVSAADYDDDGDVDLYVLNYGPNVLYRNRGDGTFEDVSEASGLGDPLWSVAAPWLDFDLDGDLDVYVVNYLEYDAGAFRDFYPAAVFPGPLSYNGQPDRLYRNNGDGTFTEVSEEAGLTVELNGRGMSAIASDLDGDGRVDLYVANDATPNFYFRAGGEGRFEERALGLGLAFGEGGQGASSMGPTSGDVDGDGRLDLYVPDMGYGCLLVQQPQGLFLDVTARARLAAVCGQYTGWGPALLDYDNDGLLDLFVSNGHAHRQFSEEDVLLRNLGELRFEDVSERSGAYFDREYVGRGVAQADYDDDGDVDLLVMVLGGTPRLLRNDAEGGHWLTVDTALAGSGSDAVGALVTVEAGGRRMLREIGGVTGYLSCSDARAHFGLGAAARAERISVRWPDGSRTELTDVEADRVVTIRQPER